MTTHGKVPKPLLDACERKSLALFVGSGLSLGADVKGNFPRWSELPARLLTECENHGALPPDEIAAYRQLYGGNMRTDVFISSIDVLRNALGRDYQTALTNIFSPTDASPGAVHHALASLSVPLILTSNYDPLIEMVPETPRRQWFTWMAAEDALNALQNDRPILFKIHGDASLYSTVILTEVEYQRVLASVSYRQVLSYMMQRYSVLFLGYGMNDPWDLDKLLRANATAFGVATTKHFALMHEREQPHFERLLREYNVMCIPYRSHDEITAVLQELPTCGSVDVADLKRIAGMLIDIRQAYEMFRKDPQRDTPAAWERIKKCTGVTIENGQTEEAIKVAAWILKGFRDSQSLRLVTEINGILHEKGSAIYDHHVAEPQWDKQVARFEDANRRLRERIAELEGRRLS
jgi:hypothetical protein